MKNKIAFFILLFPVFMITALTQEPVKDIQGKADQKASGTAANVQVQSPQELQRSAMRKAEFLAGRWKGTEKVLTPDGIRRSVESFDFAEAKLNGTVLLFQGVVKAKLSPASDPVVVYEGLGLLSYDEVGQKYRLLHFGTDGLYEAYECGLSGKTLQCERRDKTNAVTRVTIKVDDAGRWIETGERSQDGKTWLQSFDTQMEKAEAGADITK